MRRGAPDEVFSDWRYRLSGQMWQRPDGSWWFLRNDDHADDTVNIDAAPVRFWRPDHLARWVLFRWWSGRWF